MELSDFLEEWNNSSPTITVHTSGSTGAPKPIEAEKSRMLASARATCDFLGLRRGDTALLCMPIDYIAGKMMVVRSIERGLELTCVPPSNHPLASFDDGFEGFSLAAMVPSQVFCTLQVPREREMLRRIRHLIIGGGAVSASLAANLEDFPNAVWSTYGMTETLSHIALRRINGLEKSDWYSPFDGVKVSLGDDGCLIVNAPAVCSPALKTNDIALMHEDGRRFKILGRKDNVICSGGIKLQIETIEEQLRPLLKVPFCITKRPDPKFGEVAVLLIEKGGPNIPEGIFDALDTYSRPKEVIFVDRIPLTPTGKIDRAAAIMLAFIPQ